MRKWPQYGLERYSPYIMERFIHLNINLKSETGCANYYSSWMKKYNALCRTFNDRSIMEWDLRVRRSLKSAFTSAAFFLEGKAAEHQQSISSQYYLYYYAVFHAMWSVLFTNPSEATSSVCQLSHTKMLNVFRNHYCSGSLRPLGYDMSLVSELRYRREYYSYNMPMNDILFGESGLENPLPSVYGMIKQCLQLASLQSVMLENASHSLGKGALRVDKMDLPFLSELFRKIQGHAHPVTGRIILEPSDRIALSERQAIGCGINAFSVLYEHFCDEFRTYVRLEKRKDIGEPSVNAQDICSFIWNSIF